VEFIITDAPEKQPELLDDLLKLAERTNTLVFVIDVSQSPPKRTQLK
jgi:GTPase involved in cell partitioning and DNA repair